MMTEWQPIETLPVDMKDDTRILLYGYWEGEINGQDKEMDVWLCYKGKKDFPIEGCDGYAAWVNDPTHWAPAPEKPEIEE
jgi:hypothetical protein